jgi:ubiquinol-cytochrome c reductase cytochrome c subunit
VNALAARRHHRFAPTVLLALALLLTGFVYAAVAPGSAGAATPTANDVRTGGKLFVANCATCHGLAAQGSKAGPSLIGVGAASVDFQVSTGRMPAAASGPQVLARAPQFTAAQVSQLAAYVASLGAGPSVPTADQVNAAKGDVASGMALFRTNCAMCHNAVGAGGALSGGKFAPPLSKASARTIYEAMLTGPQSMPVFNDANLTPDEKRDVIAYVEAQRSGTPGGADLGSLGPVSEGLWVWVVGMGLLIGCAVWIGAKSS